MITMRVEVAVSRAQVSYMVLRWRHASFDEHSKSLTTKANVHLTAPKLVAEIVLDTR
jgi:hypothetical protein